MTIRCSTVLRFALAMAAALPVAAAQSADVMSMRLEDLMEIGVVGASKYEQQQREVAAAVSIITRQEIRAHGWRTLGEALSSLPGFTTTYDRQFVYPTLRGLGLPGDYATRVLVTINGSRLNDPLYDQGSFGRNLPLDLDLVERIEFIPGPGGAVYGQNAMFGVVNLVTRNGGEVDGLEVAVSGEQPQALREGRLTFGGHIAGDTEVLLSASSLEADGEDRFYEYGASGVSGVAAGMDFERDRELFARVRRGAWSFDALYGSRLKGDPTANFFTDPLAPGKYVRDEYRQAQFGFQQTLLRGSLDVSARLFAGRYGSDAQGTSFGAVIGTGALAEWYGGELQFVSTAIEGHKLLLGTEGQVETRRDQRLSFPDALGDVYVRGNGHRIGVYAQDEWQLVTQVAATLGLRADGNDRTGTQLSPRAGLIWRAASAATLKALYGRAHRAPNSFERDYDDGMTRVANPQLGGERVDTAELIADVRAAPDLALRATAYRWRLQDIATLGTDPDTGFVQYRSGRPVNADGIELSGDYTGPGRSRLRASVAYQQTTRNEGRRLANSPDWLGKLSFIQPLPWAGLQLAALWRYDASRSTLGGVDLAGAGIADVTLTADGWISGLELTLKVSNLFDKAYSQPASDTNWQDSLEQDGRAVQVRVGYRF